MLENSDNVWNMTIVFHPKKVAILPNTFYVNVAAVGVDEWVIDCGTFPFSRQPLPVDTLGNVNRFAIITRWVLT